jgi:hypothetical protein
LQAEMNGTSCSTAYHASLAKEVTEKRFSRVG